MKYRTVKLFDLVYGEGVSKEDVLAILADFSCPLNEDVEDFVRHKAYDFERVGMSRTYLVFAQDRDELHLCGIYSLSPGVIDIDPSISKKKRKQVFGTTYPVGKVLKTYLIGQLSKNFKDGNDHYISGELLLELAFERIRENNKVVPSTVIHIDCKDIPQLRSFYERFGFTYFKTNDNGLLVYLMPTAKVLSPNYKNGAK